jgi:hypothetical protein
MTDLVLIALINGIPITVAAVGSVVNMFLNYQTKEHVLETKKDVAVVKSQTDGMHEELMKITGEKAFMEGHAQGVSDASPSGGGPASEGVKPAETVAELEARQTKPGWWFGKH